MENPSERENVLDFNRALARKRENSVINKEVKEPSDLDILLVGNSESNLTDLAILESQIETLEGNPQYALTKLASDLDTYALVASSILASFHIALKHGTKLNTEMIEEVTENLRTGKDLSLALFSVKRNLLKLNSYLRDAVGEEMYLGEVAEKMNQLEKEVRKHSKYTLTSGEEDNSFGN